MPENPYHVAGGVFAARPSDTPFDTAFLQRPAGESSGAGNGSRRRRLWEIPHKFHCPVVGTCFEVSELRSLMHKVMHLHRDTSDFVLHTTAVGACETRSPLAELLHRTLEKRYALIIKRLATTKTAEGLLERWQHAARSGIEIPATLWAVWTHPACDSLLEQEIYGHIHMLQHQVGSGARADLEVARKLRRDNEQQQGEIRALKAELTASRDEQAGKLRLLAEQLAETRAELAGRDACLATLTAELGRLRHSLPDLKQRQALARRADDAESRACALAAQCCEQGREIERLHLQLREREAIRPAVANEAITRVAPRPSSTEGLDGKSVLCVGGRSGTIEGYRDAVERHGGRFLHHDGGLEESLHRIDSALAAADVVICQAGCISHNAYWRVKEQCKRTGKPCVFLKGAGLSSFDRTIRDFGQNFRLTVANSPHGVDNDSQ